MKKRILMAIVVVCAVASLGYLAVQQWWLSRAEAPDSAQTAQVTRGELVAMVYTVGTVQASSTISLAFQNLGQVKEVRVKEGERVWAGQVIACLDATDAELAVAQAEASLTISRARLEQARAGAKPEELAAAEASLASAQAAYEAAQTRAGLNDAQLTVARTSLERATIALHDAQAAYDRVSWRPDIGALPQSKALQQATLDYESAKANHELQVAGINDTGIRSAYAQLMSAKSQVARLKAGASSQEVTIAEAQLRQAEISLQQARKRLEATCLTAPFEGTVARLTLQVGQMVGANAAAGVLANLDSLEVAADMSEIDVAKVKAGQEVDIAFDALADRAFRGRVARVAATGIVTQGVVNYPVIIRLDGADPAVRPGMTANASIIVDRREDVLLVPNRAIRTQGGQRLVHVLAGGQATEVPVQLGLRGDGVTEVLNSTLQEGDTLLLNVRAPQQSIPGMPGGGMGFGR